MSIRTGLYRFAILFWGMAIFLPGRPLGAKTVEVEEEDDILAVPTTVSKNLSKVAPVPFALKETDRPETLTPTPAPMVAPKKNDQAKSEVPAKKATVAVKPEKPVEASLPMNKPAPAAPKQEMPLKAMAPAKNPAVSQDSSRPRVRIDDNIGFYYFVKSGFVVGEASEIVSLGQVFPEKGDLAYSTPKKCRVKLSGSGTGVKAGDRLVVYRTSQERVTDSASGFSGLWARNLAVLTVLESNGSECLAVVKKSFYPFQDADLVRDYSEEAGRWKQAQTKKSLPSGEIRCSVAGGETGHAHYSQTEFVILTAGTDQGVVEGQTFQLRAPKPGLDDSTKGEPLGLASVFYVGTNYSMAQIVHSAAPVEKGFEAYYQP